MQEQHPVILFDGICNFCNATVMFLVRRDKKATFRFATLQSDTGRSLLQEFPAGMPGADSFVLIENGRALQKSEAALRIAAHLPGLWKGLQVFRILPRFVRDALYDFIARNRYRWFGKKAECMVPSDALRDRFLD
ncbi:MAG TPA: thiol-disulfide oxidoreductase DCC family protein [Flavisolibacter sp.]